MANSNFESSALLILTLAFISAVTQAQLSCYPGTFRTASGCQKCAPGTFQTAVNATRCRPCPANTFSTLHGADTHVHCFPCARGEAYSSEGSTKCSVCPSGKVRVANQCIKFPAVSTVPYLRCHECAYNSISVEANSGSCTDCPDGQRSSANRTTCLPDGCPPGSSTGIRQEMWGRSLPDGPDDCFTCPFNDIRSAGMKQCKECPRRTVVTDWSKRTSCSQCLPGTFLDSDSDEYRFCTKCPSGTTTKWFSKLTCTGVSKPTRCTN